MTQISAAAQNIYIPIRVKAVLELLLVISTDRGGLRSIQSSNQARHEDQTSLTLAPRTVLITRDRAKYFKTCVAHDVLLSRNNNNKSWGKNRMIQLVCFNFKLTARCFS